MKNERKPSSEQKEPFVDVSAGRSARALHLKLWAELFKTTALALVALCVIVLGSAAWFVSNSRVDSSGITISHQYDTIRLATKGDRQEAEETFLELPEGTEHEYNNESYYYTEEQEIALRLSEQSVVSPGASGEVTFYVIPKRGGAQTVTVYLSLTGYAKTQEDKAQWVNDPVLDSFLSGHILLFKSHGEDGYSGWMHAGSSTGSSSHEVTVTLPAETSAGVPYPITVYWVWPLRYKNMKDDFHSLELAAFIEQETSMAPLDDTRYYFYSQIFLTTTPAALISGEAGSPEARSEAYNRADDYIGTKADYLYLTVQTAVVQMQ